MLVLAGECCCPLARSPAQTTNKNTMIVATRHFMSAIIPGADAHLLKRTAVYPLLVFQVKGKSRRFSRRDDFIVEGHRFCRIYLRDRQTPKVSPMFIVEA